MSLDQVLALECFCANVVAQQGGPGDPKCPTCPNPQQNNDFPWLKVAAANLGIWSGATDITLNGPKPKYTGTKEWTSQKASGAKFGKVLGYAGLALTAYDMYQNGVNTSNSIDAFFGGVAFAGWGAAASGVYFVGNLLTVGITGKTIGQHIDDNFYVVPVGLPSTA